MASSVPGGWRTITPRLVVHDPAALAEFLRVAFGAIGDFHPERPAEMAIGDSIVMVSGVGPRPAMPGFLYLYVDDAVGTYQRALEAGAVSVEEPRDTPYGDRRAMVEDPFGNVWQIASRGPAPSA